MRIKKKEIIEKIQNLMKDYGEDPISTAKLFRMNRTRLLYRLEYLRKKHHSSPTDEFPLTPR